MLPQTETIALQSVAPAPTAFSAYNANTLVLHCVGSLAGASSLHAELHTDRLTGQTPLANVEVASPGGAGTYDLTFTAAQMNQLPESAAVISRAYWLVVYLRTGSGDSIVKTVVALARVVLLANPAGDTPAPPPASSTYFTQEALEATYAVVDYAIYTFAQLQAAVITAAATAVRVHLYADITCTAAITLPSLLTIFYRGKKITDGGFSVLHYATMGDMTREQKFSGYVAGDITGSFGHGIAFPEWWGLIDGHHDVAIKCAVAASLRPVGGKGLVVSLAGRIYYSATAISLEGASALIKGAGDGITEVSLTADWTDTWQDTNVWSPVAGGNHGAAFWIGSALGAGSVSSFYTGVVGLTIDCTLASYANPTRRVSGISSKSFVEENSIIDDVTVCDCSGMSIGFPQHYAAGAYQAATVNGLKIGTVWLVGAMKRDSYGLYFTHWANNVIVENVTIDMSLGKANSAAYARNYGYNATVYAAPAVVRDWPLVAMVLRGKVLVKSAHVEGCGIAAFIPPGDAGSAVTIMALNTNHMMNRVSGMVYYDDYYTSTISGVATYAAGANTLLTVSNTTGMQVGQVLAIYGANGSNAAGYTALPHIVTAVPPTTAAGTVAIDHPWPGAGAVATTAGNIMFNAAPPGEPTDGVDFLGYSTAVLIGDQTNGLNYNDSVVVINAKISGFTCFFLRDRSALGSASAPPFWHDQEVTTLLATAQGHAITATGLTATPVGLAVTPLGPTAAPVGRMDVYNPGGQRWRIGSGVKTKDIYFSGNGGTTARTYAEIVAGDIPYLGTTGAAAGGTEAGETIVIQAVVAGATAFRNVSAFGRGQFPNNGVGTMAFYARGNTYNNEVLAPYTNLGASTVNFLGPVM